VPADGGRFTDPATCNADEVTKQNGTHPWWAYALLWIICVAVLLLFAALLPHLTGRPEDWEVAVPLAVLLATGAIAGPIYGSRRQSRR
jgi:peptidoglycan/LPS O-acetylase OafA/YrhL